MIVGFDFFHTINEFPEMMAGLSQFFKEQGHSVVVISAIDRVHDENKYFDKVAEFCEKIGFQYDKIHVLLFTAPTEIPELKLQVAKKVGVSLFFDDRNDVVQTMNTYGIKGIWVKRFLTKKL